MSLLEDGFELIHGVIPLELVLNLKRKLEIVFHQMSISKFGLEQQKFWSSSDDGNGIKTLRINSLENFLNPDLVENLKCHLADCQLMLDHDTYRYVSSHAFYKAPFIGNETPWHQDPAYSTEPHKYDNITFWIPLSNIDKGSSHLEFVRGSHKNKTLIPHARIRNNQSSALQAELEDCDDSIKSVYCSAGDAVAHKSYVIHRTTNNFTPESRISIILIFSAIA